MPRFLDREVGLKEAAWASLFGVLGFFAYGHLTLRDSVHADEAVQEVKHAELEKKLIVMDAKLELIAAIQQDIAVIKTEVKGLRQDLGLRNGDSK